MDRTRLCQHIWLAPTTANIYCEDSASPYIELITFYDILNGRMWLNYLYIYQKFKQVPGRYLTWTTSGHLSQHSLWYRMRIFFSFYLLFSCTRTFVVFMTCDVTINLYFNFYMHYTVNRTFTKGFSLHEFRRILFVDHVIQTSDSHKSVFLLWCRLLHVVCLTGFFNVGGFCFVTSCKLLH